MRTDGVWIMQGAAVVSERGSRSMVELASGLENRVTAVLRGFRNLLQPECRKKFNVGFNNLQTKVTHGREDES